ncbi:MAG TPA: hypothetical protein VGL27_13010 [Negativicutes bacterium]
MSINNVSPGLPIIANVQNENASVTPQATVEAIDIPVKSEMQQLSLGETLKSVLTEVANTVQNRESVLNSLPAELKMLVQAIMNQSLSAADLVSQGMGALTKAQKEVANQLQTLISALADAVTLQQEVPKELSKVLSSVFLQLQQLNTDKLSAMPGLPSTEIVSLVQQQLSDITTSAAELKAVIRQLVQPSQTSSVDTLANMSEKEQVVLRQLLSTIIQNPIQTVPTEQLNSNTSSTAPPLQLQKTEIVSLVQLLGNSALSEAELTVAIRQLLQQTGQPTATGNPVVMLNKEQVGNLRQFISSVVQQTAQVVQPEQLATGKLSTANLSPLTENDLLSFAKQLIGGAALPNMELKTGIQQLWQQLELSSQATMTEEEQIILRQLLATATTKVPQLIQQASTEQDLPEFKELWALLKLATAAQWTNIPQAKLQKASQALSELATSMQKTTALHGETTASQTTVALTIPLYFGEGLQPYPAYIHVYHEREQNGEAPEEQCYDTWLRICLVTENIGVVDMVFHLYQENQVNVRVAFTSADPAALFTEAIPDIRTVFADYPLNLADMNVSTTSVDV